MKKTTATEPTETVTKCVRLRSEKFPIPVATDMADAFNRYGACVSYFLQRFSGIRNMTAVMKSKKLRDEVRKWDAEQVRSGAKSLSETFGIQGRYWVQALFEACSCLNSWWSNLANALKKRVRENANLDDAEKAYLYYVLSARSIWQAILLGRDFEPTKKLKALMDAVDAGRFRYLHNMLRRITRNGMSKKPVRRKRRCMCIDESMYSIKEDGGETTLAFMSTKPRKPFVVKMKGRYAYAKTGDVQLVLVNGGRQVEIRKAIQARTKARDDWNETLGIDKGLHTLISCSSGNEYGVGASALVNREADRITEANTNRNHMIQKLKDLKDRAAKVRKRIADGAGTKEDKEAMSWLDRKIDAITKNNIGRTKYDRRHNAAMEELRKFTNVSVRAAYEKEKPRLVDKEDLTFQKEKGADRTKSAKQRARLASWTKGYLDERLEYVAAENRVATMDVNPAYTSQFCAECGSFLTGRKGPHHEIGVCPVCGEIDANVNAAKNVKARADDPEITLYTPYRKVKEILLARSEKSKPEASPAETSA